MYIPILADIDDREGGVHPDSFCDCDCAGIAKGIQGYVEVGQALVLNQCLTQGSRTSVPNVVLGEEKLGK